MAAPNLTPIKPIKLYYIGGFTNAEARVSARGKVYQIPPIGGYLEVEPYIADSLIRRNRFQGMSVFTKDPRMAQNAIANRNAPVQDAPSKFSREQLLEMLANIDELEEDQKPVKRAATKKVEEA